MNVLGRRQGGYLANDPLAINTPSTLGLRLEPETCGYLWNDPLVTHTLRPLSLVLSKGAR